MVLRPVRPSHSLPAAGALCGFLWLLSTQLLPGSWRADLDVPTSPGHLEIRETELRPPDRFGAEFCPTEVRPWKLPGYTSAQYLGAFLDLADLRPEERGELLRAARCQEPPFPGCTVQPGADLIAGLRPSSRAALYERLARMPANFPQVLPFAPKDMGRWIAESGLPADLQQLWRSLLYRHGDRLALADVAILCMRAGTPARRSQVVQAIGSTRGVHLKLHVPTEAELPEVARYWGAGGRMGQVEVLLRSARREGREMIEVAELLPELARTHLDRYQPPHDLLRNCHWTSLNFFQAMPQYGLGRAEEAIAALSHDYHPVLPSARRLGDVLVYLDRHGLIVHSAVYIAADVVFTKNGFSPLRPWYLSPAEALRAEYLSGGAGRELYLRRNPDRPRELLSFAQGGAARR